MIAAAKGRSPVAWFFIGCFLHLLALILVLVLSNLKVIEERHERLALDNRRLRERVRLDRQTADQRHADATTRLTVHDRALGLDTASRVETPKSAERIIPPPVPAGQADSVRTAQWFYVDERGRQGPFDFTTMRMCFERGDLQPETLVWCEEQTDWMPLRERHDLQEALIA